MGSNPEVIEMVKSYLINGGYDGLCQQDGMCACLLSDLAPCGEIQGDCYAGYKHEYPDHHCEGLVDCDGDCDWHIGPQPQTHQNLMEHTPMDGHNA